MFADPVATTYLYALLNRHEPSTHLLGTNTYKLFESASGSFTRESVRTCRELLQSAVMESWEVKQLPVRALKALYLLLRLLRGRLPESIALADSAAMDLLRRGTPPEATELPLYVDGLHWVLEGLLVNLTENELRCQAGASVLGRDHLQLLQGVFTTVHGAADRLRRLLAFEEFRSREVFSFMGGVLFTVTDKMNIGFDNQLKLAKELMAP